MDQLAAHLEQDDVHSIDETIIAGEFDYNRYLQGTEKQVRAVGQPWRSEHLTRVVRLLDWVRSQRMSAKSINNVANSERRAKGNSFRYRSIIPKKSVTIYPSGLPISFYNSDVQHGRIAFATFSRIRARESVPLPALEAFSPTLHTWTPWIIPGAPNSAYQYSTYTEA